MADRAPSRFEFEFLAYLSEHEGLTSREIYDGFGKPRGYVRGTVVKALDRLFQKGLVQRESVQGVFVYRAVPDRTNLEQNLVESFVRDRLGGRIAPLFTYFSESGSMNQQDVEELRNLLQSLDRKETQ